MSGETGGIDLAERFLVLMAVLTGLATGAVYFLGEAVAFRIGQTLFWILAVLVILAALAVPFALVMRFLNGLRWHNAKEQVKIQRAGFLSHQHHGGVVVGNVRDGRFQNFLGHPKAAQSRMAALGKTEGEAEAEPPMDALELLDDCERMAIFGGTGAGKTYLARALAARRVLAGETVVVVDPKHVHRDRMWPRGVRLAGTSLSLEQIEEAFNWIDAEAMRRGDDFDNIDEYPRVTLIFDEVNIVLKKLPHLSEAYLRIIQMYREYNIACWIIGQASGAASIGMEGKADLKRCFDALVSVRLNRRSGERKVSIDYLTGEPPIECPPIKAKPVPRGQGARPGMDWAFEGELESRRARHGRARHVYPMSEPSSGAFPGGSDRRDTCDTRDSQDGRDVPRIVYDPNAESFRQWEPRTARRFYESKLDKTAVELADDGHSLNSIAKELWGATNGRRTKRIRAILEKYEPPI